LAEAVAEKQPVAINGICNRIFASQAIVQYGLAQANSQYPLSKQCAGKPEEKAQILFGNCTCCTLFCPTARITCSN